MSFFVDISFSYPSSCSRVSSKTDIKTWNKSTGSGKLFSMDLMDESGEIRITAFKDQVDSFYDKAVVGKVYYIR